VDFLELAFPPGVRANGTDRESKGFWRDGNLVRWGPTLQPVKGWLKHSTSLVTGSARAIVTWASGGSRFIGIGTHSGLYGMTASGSLSNQTPAGFTAGRADASTGGGYGTGAYGVYTYGTPRPDTSNVNPASVWTLDVWDEFMVGCMEGDGKLYIWDNDPAHVATQISGSPTGCNGLVVAHKPFIVAIKDRMILWCDLADETVWTAASTNQAGDLPIFTAGKLQCGRKVRGATLIFSDVDVWQLDYQGPPAVFTANLAGSDCGVISKGSPVPIDSRCVWMGKEGFWLFNGYVEALPCDVHDKVFGDFNEQQASKVSGWHNADHGEVWWHYPSGSSNECDRYVAWNYRLNVWSVGALARTCGIGPGTFTNPLLVGTDGYVYDHETGRAYDGRYPYAESSPVEIDSGREFSVGGIVTDEKTLGSVRVSFPHASLPNSTPSTYGPVSVTAGRTDLRFMAGWLKLKAEFIGADDARLGQCSLEVSPRGRRRR
jgi:hypothetical protein